jgi:endonuclease YncB( thermonuclease family)
VRETNIRFFVFILIATWLPIAHAKPASHEPFEVTGNVIKNHDGDTIKLQTVDRGVIIVRFSGADTPETGQAHWKAARTYLRNLVASKPVTVRCYKTDKYEREVCHVSVGGVDAGLALVQQGYAWYAHMFSNELSASQQKAYPEAEELARRQRRGLWQDSDPMPPWECRKLRKAHQKCR